MEWISKELDCVDSIKLYEVNGCKIAEIETKNRLEQIIEQYNASKDRAEKKELKETFRLVATEMNSRYKTKYYNEDF